MIPSHTTTGPRYSMGIKKTMKHEKDGLGPGAYAVKAPNTAPHYGFGMNLKSDITLTRDRKLFPDKVDDPGPGQYENNDIQFKKPTTKFSKDGRKDLARREGYPAPNNYDPNSETEPVHSYSFPKAMRLEDAALAKSNISPGPCTYDIVDFDNKNNKISGTAVRILGGPLESKGTPDNGVPGPGAY